MRNEEEVRGKEEEVRRMSVVGSKSVNKFHNDTFLLLLLLCIHFTIYLTNLPLSQPINQLTNQPINQSTIITTLSHMIYN
jgi:hypothetical protein